MIDKLILIEKKYIEVTDELQNPDNYADIKKMTKLSKEQASMRDGYEIYQTYKKVVAGIEEAKSMLKDPEMGEFAKEEFNNLNEKLELLMKEIEIILLPKDENDSRNSIVEIRGAAGGDEANIFAGDLYRMYSKYAEELGWKIEVMDYEEGTSGGYTLMEFKIKGENVYSKMKYESGAHRVQRVPATETQGRIHTSTATVLVMPEAEEQDVDIKVADVKVDVYRSGGAGGQSVNTTDSAVRMTHLPTGIVVTCQNERSQIQNREKAMEMLRTRVYEDMIRKREEALGSARKSIIGTGDRSEKIRTYNYPQNRVTDHRIGLTIKQLDRIVEGDLSEIITALKIEEQNRLLKED